MFIQPRTDLSIGRSVYILLAKIFRRKVILHLHGGEFELFIIILLVMSDLFASKLIFVVGFQNILGNCFES